MVNATGLGSLQFKTHSPPLLSKMSIYSGSYASPGPPQISSASVCGVICPDPLVPSVKSISNGKRISGLFFTFLAENVA
ncbi:unnamed protein product [Gongylonema pulchrum]|uniref:Ovule protein n=1 Tax=Gongylonema pulchrum TaxID=637853 RepID=A0A183F0U1_9BILA|nr:unnamed protein product [Gongylonema pulchrum]